MKNLIALFLISLTYFSGFAQQTNFSEQDTLRGSITPERIWWNLLHYNLETISKIKRELSSNKVDIRL